MQEKLSVKEKALAILEENRGSSISGELIAEILGVSRNAVWKAIKNLQSSGYEIEAVRNRGYRLSPYNDILSIQGIELYLEEACKPLSIRIYKQLASTSLTAKHLAIDNVPHGTVVLSDCQTAGKGRGDKTFFSPEGSGIYLSMILRPGLQLMKPSLVMAAASVAVCRAIEKSCHLNPEIKWINDLYLNGKKVCGILTDALLNYEAGTLDALIIGIGINFVPPADGFPPELASSVSALHAASPGISPEGISRNRLIAGIITELMNTFSPLNPAEIMDAYRRRSCVIGQSVTVYEDEAVIHAEVLDIDNDGGLVIRLSDSTVRTLTRTDITLRMKDSAAGP